MKEMLNYEDKQSLLETLSETQKVMVLSVSKNRFKSKFSTELAKEKALEEWDFYDYIDHGKVTKDVKCYCGRPLRYQFLLKNRKTNEMRSLGETHFAEHMNIPLELAKEVQTGVHAIDHDLNDLLIKVRDKWEFPALLKFYFDKLSLTVEMKQLVDLNLPLLERHILLLLNQVHQIQLSERLCLEKVSHVSYDDISSSDLFKEFSLEEFKEVNEEKAEELPKKKSETLKPPSIKIDDKFYDMFGTTILSISKHVSSVAQICELLITKHHAPSERYLTGRYKILPLVVQYFDIKVQDGEMEYLQKNQQDVVVSWKNNKNF